MQLTLPTSEDAYELVFILFMRKFFGDDHMAQLSAVVNDCIEEICASQPAIHNRFDMYRDRAADAFVDACKPGRDPNLWSYIAARPTEADQAKVIASFFAPIRPSQPVPLTTPQEVANAYRT